MKTYRLLLVLFACCLVQTVCADENRLPKTRAKFAVQQPVKIVCLGDSVTGIYYHTGGLRAYPEMIAVGLKNLDSRSQVTVINAGISGNTTDQGLARLEKDVLSHQPDLVTVMFGLNDLARSSKETYQANLKAIITRCRTTGAEVLLCTPNGIIENSGRPRARLEEFNQAMKDVGEETSTPVCDVYAAYESVRAQSPLEFRLMCSDDIHPNMTGDKLNAETICQTITGQSISLSDVGPPLPKLSHTRQRLLAGETIRVLAMTPTDGWITEALQQHHPEAKVEVTRWETAGKSLAELHQSAAETVRKLSPKPDLVVLAIPLEITPRLSHPADEEISHHSWIINFSLSFGVQEWDVIGVSPSVIHSALTAEELDREAFSRKMFAAQDLHQIVRPMNNQADGKKLFVKWFGEN